MTNKQTSYRGWHDDVPLGRKLTDYDNTDPTTGECNVPTMTKQSFKDECDINNILTQYKPHEIVNMINAAAATGRYLDLPDSVDLQEAFAVVEQAQGAFASLPATVRDRFHNNPQAFLAFVENPDNADELVRLGLREAPPAQPADDPPPAPPEPPAPPNA